MGETEEGVWFDGLRSSWAMDVRDGHSDLHLVSCISLRIRTHAHDNGMVSAHELSATKSIDRS